MTYSIVKKMYYILGANVLISVNIFTLVDERHKFIFFFCNT